MDSTGVPAWARRLRSEREARRWTQADAVHALKLRRGNDALAIIKSTEVMIATIGTPTKPKGRAKS